MVVIASKTRDPEALRAGVERWLRAHEPALGDAKVDRMRSFSEGGLANETWEIGASAGAGQHSYVMRLPPLSTAVFATYDYAKEARLQNALTGTGIGTAPATYEADPQWLGSDFMLMPKIAGRVPPSQPPYTMGGWLKDEPEDFRRRLMANFTERLADLHRLDWRALGLDFVARDGGIGLRPEFDWWRGYLDFVGESADPDDFKPVAAAFDWCDRNLPATEAAPSLLWGDARLGNVVFGDDASVTALLDWEMVGIGPAEFDLGWQLAHRRNLANAIGRDDLPEIEGFPSRAEQIDRYVARLGRPLIALEWFEVFGAVRLALMRLMVQSAVRRSGKTNLPTTRPLRRWALEAMA